VGLNETLATKTKRRVRRPFHHASRGPPPPLSRGRMCDIVLALRFLFAPRGLLNKRHESFASKQRGGGAPKGARVDSAGPPTSDYALPCVHRGARPFLRIALAFRRSTAALARGLESLRLSPVPRFMVADNRSAPRAASSWQTGDVAGRASFRTARGQAYEAYPGHRSRSINQPSPVDVPWPSEMGLFSSSHGASSRNSVETRHPSDLTQVLFVYLFDSRRHTCGTLFDSYFFAANSRRARVFSDCGSEKPAIES
jgi:hypothetical protein